jgi:thiol-disulfide isomerase/thioredoxin
MPLTVAEISLMLRTGYSSNSVIEELAKRKFVDTLDDAKETKLIKAGASPELLFALKSGTYAMSAEEVAQIKQQKELEKKHRLVAAQDARRQFNTLYDAQQQQDRTAEAMRQQVNEHMIYQLVKGDLVQYRNGSLTPFDDAALENKKLFLIYFSAHWCQPCRMFTPVLVKYYNEVAAKHPDLDLIFVSRDKSVFAMETYMREANMPWPAIDFQKVAGKGGITKYAGEGIPDLVLVDATGKVLADSFQGKQYIGPAKVLSALDTILGKASPSVAQAH